MRVGIIGCGAISSKHIAAYKNIGFQVTAVTDIDAKRGQEVADSCGARFIASYEDLCRDTEVDFIDVCTFPDFRLQPLKIAADAGKHVQVQKPIATNMQTALEMVQYTRKAGVVLNVVSQHRFDDSMRFLAKAIPGGRLGKILQADAYVKWYRSAEYYSRPIKGSWATEGGGALINQGIHQVDMLLFLIGKVREVFGYWQLGALHKIESEDVITAMLKYANGATGVIQAATAFWPGYPERIEIHGTKGTCVITGDKLTKWDVANDAGEPAPVESETMSGASDPMAIPLTPFERQFEDFADAIRNKRSPVTSGEDGYRALQLVTSIYQSCREGRPVSIAGDEV
ncbi:MAG: Gfo/Idh/MocA family oxidoreductase [Bryobacterales bacterium]|nr:Gfo/Idh/MocA family oxidoreductase [Bryobacterales bacterium]